MHNNNLDIYVYSIGIHHRNLLKEQGDLFHSSGPHGKLRWPKLTQLKRERGSGKNKGECTWKLEIRTRKKFLTVSEACVV